jgi:hypothetical protein
VGKRATKLWVVLLWVLLRGKGKVKEWNWNDIVIGVG